MAEIINLRQFRKARAKAEKSARAAENRLTFGRPKAVTTLAETRNALDGARLDAHRLGDADTE